MMKQAGGDNMKIDIYKSKFFISMDFTHAEIMDTSFSKNSDSEKKILREGKKHSKEMITGIFLTSNIVYLLFSDKFLEYKFKNYL